ncbi:MAG: cbb3-type cytochrome oxidase assembly protein CcoS [Lysobacterales bacterium]
MSMIYILIPLAILLLVLGAWALIWAIRSGQFDDLETHGWSVVLDDDERPHGETEAVSTSKEPKSDNARGDAGGPGKPSP